MWSTISKYKVIQSKLRFKLDLLSHVVMGMVILSIFMLMCSAWQRPVNVMQYQQVIDFSEQAEHPKTQYVAKTLLQRQQVRRVDYLKLVHAYHFELKGIKQYPAVTQKDE